MRSNFDSNHFWNKDTTCFAPQKWKLKSFYVEFMKIPDKVKRMSKTKRNKTKKGKVFETEPNKQRIGSMGLCQVYGNILCGRVGETDHGENFKWNGRRNMWNLLTHANGKCFHKHSINSRSSGWTTWYKKSSYKTHKHTQKRYK